MPYQTYILLAVFLCTISCVASDTFELKKDDVVVLAGGTNMLHMQQDGTLEAIMTHAAGNARPKFRDFAWEADTVFRQGTIIERWRVDGHGDLDGLGDLDGQLKRVNATVVVCQFGQLESLSGRDRLDDFKTAYSKLIELFQAHARMVVLITPTPFEKPPSHHIPDLSKRNADLARYVDATRQIASERKTIFVDLFNHSPDDLTFNGMHLKRKSLALVAQEIAKQLNLKTPDARSLETLRQAVIEKHRLGYDYWRPANWKLLYGDDARRQFTRGGKDYIPFREEWEKLVPLIATAEERVWAIARGEKDPGDNRPEPEKLHGDPEAEIEKELASFTAPDGFEVNLFASEREGLTSPLAIRWDPAGRMYVTVTTTYPHVFPGDVPNDKVILLEDTNNDGVADKSNVFADGLNIPTGLEWGEGGIYVGQNTEILFLKDTDGDGRADTRQVVLSGFGNGDSHQTINSFYWSPDGELFFGHGDGCESRVETPWGASNLFNAGFYRFRPKRLQLLPFLEGHMGPGNPWGIAFDNWGQAISVDGAGGVNFLSPALINTTHRRRIRRIGQPGGYCGIGLIDGRHLPESIGGSFVTGDFKQNRVKRFDLVEHGSGFEVKWEQPILHSSHRNFRPVDVKMGPDGAIYVVDWYNPITCHQDDAYRDPTRDKAHGRIWRMSAKNASRTPINLLDAPIKKVLDALKSPEHWTRYQAKRALTVRDEKVVANALDKWVQSLDPKQPNYEQHLFHALGAYATIEAVEPRLLRRLLNAKDPGARAFATRIVGRWHDRIDDPFSLLSERIVDDHPRVRMEAVVACAAIPDARSMRVAAMVVDQPQDEWIEYALKQTIHCLEPHWLPALERGELTFAQPHHLAAVLNEAGGRQVVDRIKDLVASENLDRQTKSAGIAAILAVGDEGDFRKYGLERETFSAGEKYDPVAHADALKKLVEVVRSRDAPAKGDVASMLTTLLGVSHDAVQANALTLAGLWQVKQLEQDILHLAKDDEVSAIVRAAAFESLAELKSNEGRDLIAATAKKDRSPSTRSAAIRSLAKLDVSAAAKQAADYFEKSDANTGDVLVALLSVEGGADTLASELQNKKLSVDSAKQILRSLFATGRSDKTLFDVLNRSIGAVERVPDYNLALVKEIAVDAERSGNARRGRMLFQSMACVSCHQIGGQGGKVGPDLTAIGTTLSNKRIIEELLWPNRQVKEGFSVVQVLTIDGKLHQGYERKQSSKSAGTLVLNRIGTNDVITIPNDRIEEKRATGSSMPAGLTSVLSRSQLNDLVRYLTELGKIK